MRDIKFRGWHSGLNKMFSPEEMAEDQLTILPTGKFINVHGDSTKLSVVYEYSEMIPLQYTGLKDKNGVEIYEGDIFRVEEDTGMECDFCDGCGTVEGGKYIETTCKKCNGTGIVDEGDRTYYLVITWVKEWAMFCTLLMHNEYKEYLRVGIKALDEPVFWTYTLEDTNSRKHFLCGNIYEHKHLLNS